MNKIRRISLVAVFLLAACFPLKNYRNTYFINTSSAFLNEKGLPKDELFVANKLHLNADGYKVWTELVKDELNKVLNKV